MHWQEPSSCAVCWNNNDIKPFWMYSSLYSRPNSGLEHQLVSNTTHFRTGAGASISVNPGNLLKAIHPSFATRLLPSRLLQIFECVALRSQVG